MHPWQLEHRFDSEQGAIRWGRIGEGPPVVLVHGTPFSSYVWRDVARALSARFEVYVWDLAGFGASEQREGQDVSLAAQARILAALLEHWGLDEPDVVGHDFGGGTVLRTHLLEGRAFRRLVLVDAVAVRPWGTGFFQLAKEHHEVLRELPGPVHQGLVEGYVRWAMHHPPTPDVLAALAAPWLGDQGKAALYRQIVQNGQHLTDEVQDRYGEVEIPTLVLWGEEDRWLPVSQGEELQRSIPGSQFRTIPDAGHLVQHDAPATLAVEIASFLQADPA